MAALFPKRLTTSPREEMRALSSGRAALSFSPALSAPSSSASIFADSATVEAAFLTESSAASAGVPTSAAATSLRSAEA